MILLVIVVWNPVLTPCREGCNLGPMRHPNGLTRAEVAHGAAIPQPTAEQWMARYGLFQVAPKDRAKARGIQRRYTLNNACVVRAIRLLTEGGIPTPDAVAWCAATLPKHFEAILSGKRVSAVAEVRNVKLDLGQIARDVTKRLDLVGAVRIAKPKQPTEQELLAEVERVERYMQTQKYRDRVAAFRAEVLRRGTPTNWQEAAKALGIPLWIVKAGLAAEGKSGRTIFSNLAEQIGISDHV